MKKILLIVSVVFTFTGSFSQSIITQNLNTQVAGAVSPDNNINKFGVDSATAITPQIKDGKPFSTFPSPSNGAVHIKFDEPVKSVKFSVYNMIGNEIKNVTVEKLTDQQYRFNFGNQQPGFYFIRIQTDKFNYTTRVTITAAVAQKAAIPVA